jgi:hypothetical protein
MPPARTIAHRLAFLAKQGLWQAAYPRWPAVGELRDGYTVLLPVPGDLPVFLHLAAAVVSAQDPAGRLETIVVPDAMTPAFERAFADVSRRFEWGPLRLAPFGARGRALKRGAGNPATNYFLQLYHGAAQATSTHVLLHDADLFIDDPGFLAGHFARARDGGAACLGVSPVWDSFLREHGGAHVVATWELMLDQRWLRASPPWRHRPHSRTWAGREHGFDVTLLPQIETPPERCALNPDTEGLLHFNYVFGTFRRFQRGERRPMEDQRFLLLLIRLLVDAFHDLDAGHGVDEHADLPDLATLARGLVDGGGVVTYRAERTAENYADFRSKLERLIQAPFVGPRRAEVIVEALRPFDDAFGGVPSGSA